MFGSVFATANAATARKVFAVVKKERDKIWCKVRTAAPLRGLPRYGDQQVALHDRVGAEGIGQLELELLGRRNTTIWLLHVTIERRPAAPAKELLGELTKYAFKLKARIGRG
jgi:hypothetical protein